MLNILSECRRLVLPRLDTGKDFRGSTVILGMCLVMGGVVLLAFMLTRLAAAI